jgi:hypothetical protein
MSWIRIINVALFDFNLQNELIDFVISIESGYNLFERNDFDQGQSILFAQICNNKRSDNSYELCYQLIDPVMISFELIYMHQFELIRSWHGSFVMSIQL